MDSTLSAMGSTPKQLKIGTLLTGLVVPVLVSAGPIVKLSGILIGSLLKSDKITGASPLLLANVVVALFIAVIVCLTLVYLLSIAHLTDNKRTIVFALLGAFVLSSAAVGGGLFPAFNVVDPKKPPEEHRKERKESRKKEHRDALEKAFSLNVPHAMLPEDVERAEPAAETDRQSTECHTDASILTERESRSSRTQWDELLEKLFDKDECGNLVLKKDAATTEI